MWPYSFELSHWDGRNFTVPCPKEGMQVKDIINAFGPGTVFSGKGDMHDDDWVRPGWRIRVIAKPPHHLLSVFTRLLLIACEPIQVYLSFDGDIFAAGKLSSYDTWTMKYQDIKGRRRVYKFYDEDVADISFSEDPDRWDIDLKTYSVHSPKGD